MCGVENVIAPVIESVARKRISEIITDGRHYFFPELLVILQILVME
jgi:hypothetical protein